MLNALKDFIKKHALFNINSDKILLAVSGGVDSVVMWDLFDRLKVNYVIGHCNFHLRGEDADLDEKLVKEMAEKYNATSFFTHFDTRQYARLKKISIEMAARDLRYEWLYKIMYKHKLDFIATAHHQGDVLETIIFNLSKGTGIAGLQGIKPKRDTIIRPIWFATRNEIEAYARDHQLQWRIDQSNLSEEYTRNMIRHRIVPVLKEINPNLHTTFKTSLEKINAVANIFYGKVNAFIKQGMTYEGNQVIIQKNHLLQLKEPVIILSEVIKEFNFNYSQSKQILNTIDKQSGKKFISATHELIIDRDQIYISEKMPDNDADYSITPETKEFEADNIKLNIKILPAGKFRLDKNPSVASLDYDKLSFPLHLRHWKEGDRFVPFGMKGQKKLSDFMIDEKIPLNLKKRIYVLESGNQIAWIAGYRIDERFKITSNTRKVFQISIKS